MTTLRERRTQGAYGRSRKVVPQGRRSANVTQRRRANGEASLDHLIRAQQQRIRDREPDRLRGLHVDG
jgi:hypothetical protein